MKKLKSWGARVASAIAVGFILVAISSAANAGFVASGTTAFGPTPTGSVEFAVYKTAPGGNWATALGFTGANAPTLAPITDSPNPPDTTSTYVYLYEVKVPVLARNDVAQLQVSGIAAYETSYGYVPGEVFTSIAPTVGVGAGSTALSATIPGSVIAGNSADAPYVNFFLSPALTSSHTNSVLMFITSNQPPQNFISGLHDGSTSFGSLPAPVPVPGMIALMLTGIPGFAGMGLFWKRSKASGSSVV